MNSIFLLPVSRFVGVILVALIIFASALISVTSRPHIVLPDGAQILSLNGIVLSATDTIEEPDKLGTVAKMDVFFERQTLLAAQLQGSTVNVGYQLADGTVQEETRLVRTTTLSDLPFVFWFQNLVGLVAMIVGGWVFSLRRDAGVIALLVLGFGLQVSSTAASIYSARQVALPGDAFERLSQTNHLGAAIFGTALVCLFMLFPRRLVHQGWLAIPVVVFTLFHLSDVYGWTPELLYPIAILLQLVVALVFGIIQFRKSRLEPVDRAGLRWFLLTTFVGCALFVALSILPQALGISEIEVISQGYAFGFFSFIHVGLALGVSRFRLFSLDQISYHIWLWIGAGILILAVDALILFWLRAQPWASLTAALLIGSFLYFPLRQLLIARFITPRRISLAGKVPRVVSVGLAPTRTARSEKWDALLQNTFQPASEIAILDHAPDHARLTENGLSLEIPAIKDLKGRRLRYAALGRRLFNTNDLELVATLMQIQTVVMESREAFETGAVQERERISRDVHDNIGAQLLGALHTPQENRKDEILRDTLAELRTIVNEGFQSSFPLWDVMMDIRNETGDRVELHGIALDWPIAEQSSAKNPDLPYAMINALRSMLREIVSNALKYSKAQTLSVHMAANDDKLELSVWDDGVGFNEAAVKAGNGLANIESRVKALNGTSAMRSTQSGTRFEISLPLTHLQPSSLEDSEGAYA